MFSRGRRRSSEQMHPNQHNNRFLPLVFTVCSYRLLLPILLMQCILRSVHVKRHENYIDWFSCPRPDSWIVCRRVLMDSGLVNWFVTRRPCTVGQPQTAAIEVAPNGHLIAYQYIILYMLIIFDCPMRRSSRFVAVLCATLYGYLIIIELAQCNSHQQKAEMK